jgi:hypothetical protein
MALKLAALVLLWWLFFSPVHRTAVDADAAGQRLRVSEAATHLMTEPPRAHAAGPAQGTAGD